VNNELVGVLAHADLAHHRLVSLERIRKRDLHRVVAEEAVGLAEVRDCRLGALLERRLETRAGFLIGNLVELGRRKAAAAGEHEREQDSAHELCYSRPAACACRSA
jgi:hypothetical protein